VWINTGPESGVPPAASGGGGAAEARALAAQAGRESRPSRDSLGPAGADAGQGRESPYDVIARLYDPWSRSVSEDVDFYVEEARAAGGDVVELGVGTGRIAIPIAAAGVRVIGVDSSRGMLDVCAERAGAAGVADRVDLRLGDLREPPVDEPVPLVLCPFRSYLHLLTAADRRRALAAAYRLLVPGGRLVFDVFAPGAADVAETHGRWLEREPGIFERADWDVEARTLTLSVRGDAGASTMTLAWLAPREWRSLLRSAGFAVEACYGWFDRRPYGGGEDTVWIARRPGQ
jgi:SAM-dependent methyltransferase